MTRPVEGGRFSAAVSIRSGSGRMTHDRVLRFVPLFDTPDQASRYAAREALAWLGADADVSPSPSRTRSAKPWPRKT